MAAIASAPLAAVVPLELSDASEPIVGQQPLLEKLRKLLALALADHRRPVVAAEDLGAMIVLARTFDASGPRHPDVDALLGLTERSRAMLAELVAAESVRAAATALGMHHSSLQSRHESWTHQLSYDPRSPRGRARYEAARLLAAADRICSGRLVASHEGGYSAGHVPFCGLAVIETLSGLAAGIEDPFAYLDQVTGQELQPHQREAVESVSRLVAGVPS
mgnify:CR=1 FL=1